MKPIGTYLSTTAQMICDRNATAARERADTLDEANVPCTSHHRKLGGCATCNDAHWLRVDVPAEHPDFGTLRPCPDCGEVEKMQAVRRRRDAAIPGEMQGLSFPTFRAYTPFLQRVFNLVQDFCTRPSGFLYLHGQPGNGKTHLAAAAAMRLVDQGYTTRFYRMVDLARSLREASMSDPGMLGSLLRQLENIDLLVLDDFPPEHMTPFLYEQLYAVLDYRYVRGGATIITSNLPIESLDMPRLVSRINDNRRSTMISMDAEDYRQLEDRLHLPFSSELDA